jgi:hypothetical protein
MKRREFLLTGGAAIAVAAVGLPALATVPDKIFGHGETGVLDTMFGHEDGQKIEAVLLCTPTYHSLYHPVIGQTAEQRAQTFGKLAAKAYLDATGYEPPLEDLTRLEKDFGERFAALDATGKILERPRHLPPPGRFAWSRGPSAGRQTEVPVYYAYNVLPPGMPLPRDTKRFRFLLDSC